MSPIAGKLRDELVRAYAAPERHYHNLAHIEAMLGLKSSYENALSEPQNVEAAIWFHDAVYDTRAGDNEEKSAELAKTRIRAAREDINLLVGTFALVLATKTHDPSLHPDAPLMVDIDLSILARPEERFWEYEAQIRCEYDWVPEAIFSTKRAEMLVQFLARERIYSTQQFFDRYEKQARANLQASVQKLRSGR